VADTLSDEQPLTGFAQTLFGTVLPLFGLGTGLTSDAPDLDTGSADKLPGLRDMLLAMRNPDLQTASAALPKVIPVHVPTGAPAAVAQNLPVAAVAPGKPIPSSGDDKAALDQLTESQRPDLGLEGDAMRGMLWPGFTRDLFDNYWQGDGEGVQLSGARFKDIADYAGTLKPEKTSHVTGPNGQALEARLYNLYGSPDYARSLGRSTLFYNQSGKPVGFYDVYNFDPSSGKRSGLAEFETRAMHALGPLHGAQDFPIYYGEYTPLK
jgi:hypothetical protein